MSILVCKAGVLDTIQDSGRYGYGHWGINPNGAMDRLAMQTANILVGNDMNAAVLELHFPAPLLKVEKPVCLALSGADFSAEINGIALPLNRRVMVPADSLLRFRAHRKGMRCYLAIKGGFKVPLVLNSYSTNLATGFGGYEGRALKKDDRLETACELSFDATTAEISRWFPMVDHPKQGPAPVMVLTGPEWEQLDDQSKDLVQNSQFVIGPRANRMGYLLEGYPLRRIVSKELLSSPVNFGTIQLLPGGQLMVLMADHQTTGGYPRILQVAMKALPTLAQLPPGSSLRFVPTCLAEAVLALEAEQARLRQLQSAVRLLN